MMTPDRNSHESPYFVRESATQYRPSLETGGSWNNQEQHIAPVVGLISHLILTDRDERHGDSTLRMSRLSCDILGVIPIEPFDVELRVVRPGRTIELVEAILTHGGRPAVSARAWLTQEFDTEDIAGTTVPRIPSVDELPSWDMGDTWDGAFVETLDVRRQSSGPGVAQYWIRPQRPLLTGEPVSNTARLLSVADLANGSATLVSPDEVAFPNLDLTAHLYRVPVGEWLGFDTHVSIGPCGAGLTQSILHDAEGPIGTLAQTLTVRPRRD
ncbi:thioesterase family protein [Gulosibacter sediminis]|uniref:thioesterase family protein n=1 Tax=Gulosibacter sediminis TaxID=1729695 RepID=UPI0024A99F5C|nr:thioesterase family protein [Gulosibacter sediminis]